uniref:Protein S-acyltransferase n=1 Tax=Chromera velia CCMP2878 TaxID=1169474 RepID=A0A0G4HGI8_9ALVE|eukprot:Cvel_1020.t1-p1 / transcript=Cvel_1020.t1 / gene=Cvel_1020 / organism=Chromera_velia_CCMP2878 / gene_product=Palmitoyltransferase ZDHHC15, putative / transcript_product=Palmitoyltransferase ZDHHC15, putative / location=Cvel_scaffold33:98070-98463(+) / protein_length=93 / sequence_SO=supercontig / SO=protein_coding / is_pseudo=false
MIALGSLLALFLGFVVGGFALFHTFLIIRNMTTVEFCERRKRGRLLTPGGRSRYDLGFWNNVKAALGDNPMFWLAPYGGPSGDGLSFPTRENL